jgi:steroid 5-alpha reductase family enzyme
VTYYLTLATLLFAYMSFWFLVSLIKKRNDVADVAWGLGFVLMAWAALYLSGTSELRPLVVNSLVTVWGLRLAWYIHARNKGKTEDYRYAQWRKDWGKWFYLRSYGQVYLLQGVLLFLIATPVMHINSNVGSALSSLDAVGLAVWLLGFYFESVGDAQLARFIKDPANKGHLMQSGLWAYTRHPNYFGEVTQWWGIWIIALSVSGGAYAVIGPLTITFLILKVSGVPLLEQKMAENPGFAEYRKRTSMFIPLPRRPASHNGAPNDPEV